ncbi:MAG: zinc ABC transporter substrate-binding protein [Cryomorphaceae bacterium]|nr:zinc ABC transporter substrate-binding protein [Cryomorphaceae bacterium]
MSTHILQKSLVAVFFCLFAWGCQENPKDKEKVVKRERAVDLLKEEEKIVWMATTGMIADALENLGEKFSRVHTMMGPGIDPHLYKPTPADLSRLEEAHFFCHNGMNLEGKLGKILEDSWGYRRTYAIIAGLNYNDLIPASDFEGSHDPHIWFDLRLWSKAVDSLSQVLGNLYPRLYNEIQGNSQRYRSKLEVEHEWAVRLLGEIPKEKRVLVTAHDAFRYFGRAYDVEVKALQGISTVSEYGIRDVSDLVNFLVDNKIPAIFPETSISDKALKAVVEGCRKKGWEVKLGNTLYGDALGEKDSPEGTLIGAFRHNVISIYEALSGETYQEEQT